MNVSNTLEDIVDNFKQDLEIIKQEIEDKKLTNIDRKDRKKLLKRMTTEYDIYEDDFDSPEDPEKVSDGKVKEEKDQKELKLTECIQQETSGEQTTEKEKVDETAAAEMEDEGIVLVGVEDEEMPTTEGNAVGIRDKDTDDIKKQEESLQDTIGQDQITGETPEMPPDESEDVNQRNEDNENDDEEFIKLIIMDNVKLVQETLTKKIIDIEPTIDKQCTEELGFDLADIDLDYDLDSLDKMSTIIEKLDEDNMNVLLQKVRTFIYLVDSFCMTQV